MKKTIILLFAFCLTIAGNAQSPETSLAAVHYDFIHVVDTTQKDAPYKDDVILYLGKNTSLYTSYSNILTEARMKNFILKNPDVKLGPATVYYGAPISCFKDNSAHKLSSISIFKNNYLIEEDEPKIDWNISEETKEINGYKCQKATTFFRGRSYEAWFTNQLPFSNGPWKLGGLPGLILEASDAQKEVVFRFKSFDETVHDPITLPINTIKTTTKELNRTIAAEQNGASKPDVGGMTMIQISPISTKNNNKKQYNNPIEKNTN